MTVCEMDIPYDIVNAPPLVQQFYLTMVGRGTGPRLAEMLALQTPPRANTDREFMEGYCNGNQFADREWQGDFYRGVAQEAGLNTHGRVYLSGLASFPGDPDAWVSGRGDALRVAKKKNLHCEGMITNKAVDFDPVDEGKPYQVADDIVDAELAKVVTKDPSKANNLTDTRHELSEKLSGRG